MPNIEFDDSRTYHWTELHAQADAPLLPDMLYLGGIKWPINCRLKGEGTKGVKAVPPMERLVQFDLDYCVKKLQGRLKHLSKEDCEVLFTEVLSRFDSPQLTEDSTNSDITKVSVESQPELSPEPKKTKEK